MTVATRHDGIVAPIGRAEDEADGRGLEVASIEGAVGKDAHRGAPCPIGIGERALGLGHADGLERPDTFEAEGIDGRLSA